MKEEREGRGFCHGQGLVWLKVLLFVSVFVLLALPCTESKVSYRASTNSYRTSNSIISKPVVTVKTSPRVSTVYTKPVSTVKIQPINTVKTQPINTVKIQPINTVKIQPVSPVLTYPTVSNLIKPAPSVVVPQIVTTKVNPLPAPKPAPISSPVLISSLVKPSGYSYLPTVSNYISLPLPVVNTVPKPAATTAKPATTTYRPIKNYDWCGTGRLLKRRLTVREECRRTVAGREYAGSVSRTRSGQYCESWAYAPGHRYPDKNFPDGDIYYASNQCRNPDPQFTSGPWCYTRNPKASWELCDVPFCPGFPIPVGGQNISVNISINSTGSAKDPFNVCKQKTCPYGSRCEYIGKISPTEARCVCPTQPCPSTISPLCGTNGVTYDNECQLMKAQCNSNITIGIRHQGKCYEMCKTDDSGRTYMGNVTWTRSGRTCQYWTAQYPTQHRYTSSSLYPDGDLTVLLNKCRNPDPANKKAGPWCYTTWATSDWDYCDVPSCSGCQKLDIVLAVHQSSNIALQYWADMLTELGAFLSSFTIGPNNVRVGLMTYGTRATVRFHLNQLKTKEEVVKELQKITYSMEKSNVSGALWTAQQMFREERGDRADVQNVLVLLSAESETYYYSYSSINAQYMRQLEDARVQVYAVGVGYNAHTYWLESISTYSSDKKKKLAYYNGDIKRLYAELNNAAIDICRNSPDNDRECTRTAGGWDYVGSVTRTKSGLACRSWASESVDERHRYTSDMFPDGSLEAAGTKCRNPDRQFTGGPWCFTNNAAVPWEICDIKSCTDKVKRTVKSNVLTGSGLLDLGSIGLPSRGSQYFDPCSGKQCPYGSRCESLVKEGPTATHCVCPTQVCPKSVDQICGSDGVTYDNECLLMKAQCAQTLVAKSSVDRLTVLHRGKCRCERADVVFILDGSGSIIGSVWTRILQFTKDIVNSLNVGLSGIRVGALEFGTQASIKFHLDSSRTKQDVLSAIDRIRKSDGGTNTADALLTTNKEMFQERRGDRKDVPNIAILITDGESTVNTQRTLQYAEDAKKAGITILAVGVQYQSTYYTRELNQIASVVNGVRQVYHINNVYSIGNLHKTVGSAVCVQASDPCVDKKCLYGAVCKTDPVVPGAPGGFTNSTRCVCPSLFCPQVQQYVCGDDGLTYESECHLTAARCEKQRMINVQNRGVCPDPCSTKVCPHWSVCRSVGSATSCVCPSFTCSNVTSHVCGSDNVTYVTECHMKKAACDTKRDIRVQYQGQCVTPPTVLPMENKSNRTDFFCKSTIAGAEFRGNVTTTLSGKMCQSWGSQAPTSHIFTHPSRYPDGSAVAAGNQCRNPDPAGRKAGPWCFTTEGQGSWEYCDVPSCSGCELVDIVFVLDSSVSIGYQYWPKALEFVKKMIKNFHFGETAAKFGVVTYGYQSSIEFHLNQYSSKEEVLAAVDKISYKAESTNTSGAIWTMKEKMFRADKGDRSNAANICVLVTDGVSNMDEELTVPYATGAKKAGITMFAVGVGSFIDDSELRGVASKVKGKEEVYYVSNYDSLLNIRDEISRAICTGASTA